MADRKAPVLWDRGIVGRALAESFRKLDPRVQLRNPVMFVVEVTALAVTIIPLRDWFATRGALVRFELQIALWLWFTVLFANFAEAMAEGRGKAQADNLRKTRTETFAKLAGPGGSISIVPATSLRRGDVVLVEAGDVIPGDGEVIEGIAAVNEAAITGESAPVIRESGGDRSAVTGGTTVISDFIKVKITANPGETFMDRMIGLVEGAQRQKTPNEIALGILLAGLTVIFLLVCVTLYPYALYGGTVLSLPVIVALLDNINLAGDLGAETVWLKAPDPVKGMLDYARDNGISKIIVGRSHQPRWRRALHRDVTARIIASAPDIDVEVLGDDTGAGK